MEDSAPILAEVAPDASEDTTSSSPKPARFLLRDVLIGAGVLVVFRVVALFAEQLKANVPTWLLVLLAMVLPQMLLLAWPMWLLWRRRQTLPGRRPRGEYVLIEVILGFAAAGGLYCYVLGIGLLLRWLWPEVTVNSQNTTSTFLNGPWMQLLLILFLAAIVAPICEEVFFRGFLYNALRQRMPIVWAILLQAVIFGAVHTFGVLHSILVSGVAVGLTLLYQWRKTLVTPVVAHCAFNAVQLLLLVVVKFALSGAPFLGIAATSHEDGIQVTHVAADSPAEEAGIAVGDVITYFNGYPVRTFLDLQAQLMLKKPGDKVPIELLRDGEIVNVTAVLAKRPEAPGKGAKDKKP